MNSQDIRIMVVDDDPNIGQLIQLYLEKEGFVPEYYMDGISGLEGFRKNPPHLIILDIMLPKMDGWDVCKNIRRTSQIPIIMLTAKGRPLTRCWGSSWELMII